MTAKDSYISFSGPAPKMNFKKWYISQKYTYFIRYYFCIESQCQTLQELQYKQTRNTVMKATFKRQGG